MRQRDLTAEKLAELIKDAMERPEMLAKQAQCAKNTAVPDAAQRLANLVEFHA